MEACLDPATMDPYTCPAGIPPPGVLPMNPNPEMYSPHGMDITMAVSLIIVVPAIAIRLFTKGYILRMFQAEDYFLLAALLGCLAVASVMTYAYSTFRIGRHQWDTSVADFQQTLKYINVVQILYSPFMIFAKTALLLQIQRIFVPPKQRNSVFWASWTLIVLNFIVYTTIFFTFTFSCYPREKAWNPMLPGKCMDTGVMMISTSVINLLSDASILVLPIRGVWDLHMSMKKKLGVAGIFATGLLAIAASITRLIYTIHLAATLKAPPGIMDLTYKVAPTGMWAAAEFATVLLCCTFPTFPRFISWVRSNNEKTRLDSLQYSSESQARRLRTILGEKTLDTRISSTVKLWELPDFSGRGELGKDSQETLGLGIFPPRIEEGGIWRSVEIETTSMKIDV